MNSGDNYQKLKKQIPSHVTIVAVSKTHSAEKILEVYHTGHKVFGENRVQELLPKYEQLPKDIQWHLIGHLQTNKVKFIAPFVSLIHSCDSLKLLIEINKCAEKENRVIDTLLQIHIAQEETKFGLNFNEADAVLSSAAYQQMKNTRIVGLMGMATLTKDVNQIRNEFLSLKDFFDQLKRKYSGIEILSMGMSSDYNIAINAGSNLIRVGSAIFGTRT